VLNFGAVLLSAFMGWKLLSVLMNNASPIVVVLSESMSPAFERGDILFLENMHQSPLKSGDICVFNIKGKDIPIVHRIVKIHASTDDLKTLILTKGDHNMVHDRGLYNRGQKWLQPDDIVGRVKGYIPGLTL
jgi:signal peptidase